MLLFIFISTIYIIRFFIYSCLFSSKPLKMPRETTDVQSFLLDYWPDTVRHDRLRGHRFRGTCLTNHGSTQQIEVMFIRLDTNYPD
jgi:hypothetical protein